MESRRGDVLTLSAPLYLIPGWSFDGLVFDGLRARLPAARAAAVLELPGHGGPPSAGEQSGCREFPEPLSEEAARGAVWIGWSLGGTHALEQALRPGGAALVMLAATPRFTSAPDWPHGVAPAELAAMRRALKRNPEAVVGAFRRRLGAVSAADRRAAAGSGSATVDGLAAGLKVLAEADLRAALTGLQVPTLWIGGRLDPLVPPEALEEAAALAGGECRIIDGAGHLPHVTHAGEVAAELKAFFIRHDLFEGGRCD